MKRTGSYEMRSVPPVRLYLEDYSQLIELISQDHHAVMVTADNWQLDSPDEIEKIKEATVHRLEVNSFASGGIMSAAHTLSSFSVTITGPRATVCFVNVPGGAQGLALQVLDLLQKKRSKTEIFKWILAFIPLLVVPAVIVREYLHPAERAKWLFSDGLTLIGSMLLTTILGTWCYWWQSGKAEKSAALILKRRSEATSFWGRNKDDLISKAIIAVLGALVGGLIGAALKH